MTDQMTLRARRLRDGMAKRATWLGRHIDGDGWEHDQWRVTLRYYDKSGPVFTTEFRQGTRHEGKPPTVEAVLECLLSDCSGVENEPVLENWATSYGMSPDSRRAEQLFIAVCTQRDRVKAWLGDKYEAYLWHTDSE